MEAKISYYYRIRPYLQGGLPWERANRMGQRYVRRYFIVDIVEHYLQQGPVKQNFQCVVSGYVTL